MRRLRLRLLVADLSQLGFPRTERLLHAKLCGVSVVFRHGGLSAKRMGLRTGGDVAADGFADALADFHPDTGGACPA